MRPFRQFPEKSKAAIRYVLTDIDDTLTIKGRLPAAVFVAMERLQQAGMRIVPVTGRPAGWCDNMARFWPIDAVVGENGAFYFRYNPYRRKMIRRYWKSESERRRDRRKLDAIKREILKKVPGCRVASDQAYREADLAIDYREDVKPLSRGQVEEIVRLFEEAGAQAKISSIHVNGWFGPYDKLSMTRLLFKEVFRRRLDGVKERIIFTGDSPNDSPLFGFFPHSVGVANVGRFKGRLDVEPVWVTRAEGGYGFSEMAGVLLGG